MCGDIICLQRRLTDAEARALKHPTVKSFLEYIQNSKSVNFRPLMNPKVLLQAQVYSFIALHTKLQFCVELKQVFFL